MHLDERVIGDYVDDALDPGARSEVDRHLEQCESCQRLVDDLRQIRRTAASLDRREPPARVWARIERAIRLETEHRADVSADRSDPRHAPAWVWLAAAAVLVIASVVGVRYTSPERSAELPSVQRGAPSAAAGSSEAVQSVEAELREAEAHYERAFRGLEQIASAGKGAFDPATAAALQKNFAVIDQAINESRAALRAQPTSDQAHESLIENFKTKLRLLQDTVALINEMRKGNEEGTARIVSGLKQKGD